MTIGERIKNRREELGLTQDELAKKCGYKSRSSINKIELSRDLPIRKVSLMAEALETTPAYLMGWEEREWSDDNIVMEQFPEDVAREKLKALAKGWGYGDEEVERAFKIAELYKKADPETQHVVDRLLKPNQQDS